MTTINRTMDSEAIAQSLVDHAKHTQERMAELVEEAGQAKPLKSVSGPTSSSTLSTVLLISGGVSLVVSLLLGTVLAGFWA